MKKVLIKQTEKKLIKVANQFANESKRARIKDELLTLNRYLIEMIRPLFISNGDIEGVRHFQRIYSNVISIASNSFITVNDLSINNIKTIMIAAACYLMDDTCKSVFLHSKSGLVKYCEIEEPIINDVHIIMNSAYNNTVGFDTNDLTTDITNMSSDLTICSNILSDAIISYIIHSSDKIINIIVGDIMDCDAELNSEDILEKAKAEISNISKKYNSWSYNYTKFVLGDFVNMTKNMRIDIDDIKYAITCYENRVNNMKIDIEDMVYDEI